MSLLVGIRGSAMSSEKGDASQKGQPVDKRS